MKYLFRTLTLLMCFSMVGCNAQDKPGGAATGTTQPSASAKPAAGSDDPKNLTIYGYNYTDTEIGSFEVNGRGGGNLMVSGLTSSGGSSVCCFTLYPLLLEEKTKIKWTRDGDTWCEFEALILPPLPAKPEYLEVHFYQDGHIELAVTEESSDPRLKLERLHGNSRHKDPKKNVVNDGKFGACKRGYR